MPQNLQLTILNERGRIWTLVAGGGASVIFADTIVEKSNVEDLANYGEYSGAPNEEQVKHLRDPGDNFINS
jgi:succinyl-CoA synthetase beta subunit